MVSVGGGGGGKVKKNQTKKTRNTTPLWRTNRKKRVDLHFGGEKRK